MISPENRLFCRLDGLTGLSREQQRLEALATFGLLNAGSIPVFDEATQTAARFLEAPICVLSLIDENYEWLKSAVGLSRLGLMNRLAASRQISRQESFGTHVVDSQQVLMVTDTMAHPAFSHSLLVQQYGIRAYLGVPLLTAAGQCLGALAIMDLSPREFTLREVEFLELEARWSMSEMERNHLAQQRLPVPQMPATPGPAEESASIAESTTAIANSVRVELIAQLAQELRTPLTSIMGMTSVLSRKIYGPLTDKQQEYIDVMRDSGQCLLSLVDEIMELGNLDDQSSTLNLAPVDVEMVCQQAIKTLSQFSQRQDQEIQLSVEPGPRIWLLDKDKVRQMLYHLTFSVIHCSCAGSIVHIHVSRKQNRLNIAVWVSNPWLGTGFAAPGVYDDLSGLTSCSSLDESMNYLESYARDEKISGLSHVETHGFETVTEQTGKSALSRESLGLLLSRQLAEQHGGEILMQGSPEAGPRYVISLPKLADVDSVTKESAVG